MNTITGLELHANQFSLDQITKLVSIPGYEVFKLVKGHEYYFSSGNRRLLDLGWIGIGGSDKCCLVTTVNIRKSEYAGSIEPYLHLVRDIERSLAFIRAIRLIKPGVPKLHGRVHFHMSNFPFNDPLAYCDNEGSHGLYQGQTILEKSDFYKVRKLWKELLEKKSDDFLRRPSPLGAIDTALERLMRTYTIKNWLDCIIDLTIALEALIGPSDNQELSHRIALRASWLLEKDTDSSNRIYKIVRAMYDIRSARVHGRRPPENKVNKWLRLLTGIQDSDMEGSRITHFDMLERALESVREIVRKAINACMNLNKLDTHGPHWPLPTNFDENIVRRRERGRWQKAARL